jgi:hypothetical protein
MLFKQLGIFELLIILAVCATPLIAPVVIAWVVVSMTKKANGQLKKCPYCAELIRPEAVVCRFCGRDINPAED